MTRTVSQALTFLLALALVPALPAWAGQPTDQLSARVNRVVSILKDPVLKQDSKTAERRAQIRHVADEVFELQEISRRSLGRHWQARTPAERDEFVQVFGEFLEWSWISKMERYTDEKVVFLGDVIDGDLPTVKARIVSAKGTEIPVDYRMVRGGDRWRVFDVLIEGVSLVANYRSQFDKIIQRTSYADLVSQLKEHRAAAVASRTIPAKN